MDRQLATALPGVSALGECCEIDGQTWGLVAPCLRQAEVLAGRLCGTPEADFHWQDSGTRLKVTGIALFSAGDPQASDHDEIWTSWDPLARHTAVCWSATANFRLFCCWATAQMPRRSPRCWLPPRSQTGFLILLQRSRALQVNFL